MSKPIDDPRLTAYALGELPDRERHDIEALLRDSAAARAWVEQVRETGHELRHALQSAAATGDLPASCDASAADRSGGNMNFAAPALGGAFAGASLRHWLHIVRLPLAVAASLTLTVLVAYPLMTPQLSRSRGIASRERDALSQREQGRSEYKGVAEGTSTDKKQYAYTGAYEYAGKSGAENEDQRLSETRKSATNALEQLELAGSEAPRTLNAQALAASVSSDASGIAAAKVEDLQFSDPGTAALTGTNWSGTTNPPSAPAVKDTVSRLVSDLEMSRLPWTPQPAESETVAGQIVVVQSDQTDGRSAAPPQAYLLYGGMSRDQRPAITDPGQRSAIGGTPPVSTGVVAPASPDEIVVDSFSGNNWLIGGNVYPEATGGANYTVNIAGASYATTTAPDMVHDLRSVEASIGDSGGNGSSESQDGEKVAMKVVLGSGMVSINGGQFRSLYDPTSSSPEYAFGLDSFQYDADEIVGDPFSGGNWLIGGNLDLGMPMQLGSHDRDTAAVEPPSAEAYAPVVENPFLLVEHQPLSTFSIDVDTASYTNIRRFLNQGQLPPPGAVRIEEMINYFTYNYPQPTDGHPFATTIEVAECPWAPNHRLARIGVQGEIVAPRERPAANLVFLVDVSGSMYSPNKLPLVKKSLAMLLDELAPRDRVAVVTYAGTAGVALPSTPLSNPNAIVTAVDALQSGGSTNGASGITMAYDQAEANFIEGGINRVIIATDGDFNVGVTSQGDLLKLIEDKAKSGVFLSVLGYGMGNLKDATLELLADKGNGHYAYIDSIDEARHVLVEQMMGTLMTIAKDVKIQVEFNPAKVGAYRLVGYENRMLQAKDFNDDTKDAGEIGSGHSVTALYEIVPAGMTPSTPGVDPLKYQKPRSNSKAVVATQDAGGEGEVVDGARVVDSVEDPGIADAGDQAGEPSAAGEIMAVGSATEVDDNAAPQVGEGLEPADAAVLNELLTVKLRYKRPDGDVSTLIEVPVTDDGLTLDESSDDFAFAAAVASFGMLLRDSAHAEGLTFDAVVELASTALGADESGERAEFTSLVTMARDLRAANQPQ